jgi:uroporphyrinogen-III decarboxylase
MEQYLVDLLLEREKIGRLHDRIVDVLKIQMGRLKEAGADSIMFCEDWGTQTQLLINPALWRDEYKPRFKTLCDWAHQRGLKMFMHSCGKVTDIIPDLIASGIDLLQFDQPALHGIDTLKEMQTLGNITFWCPVDIQKTLQTKDEAAIRAEARELLEKLWQRRGGFIAGFYTDDASIGLEPKWQQIASDEFLKKGKREFFDRK